MNRERLERLDALIALGAGTLADLRRGHAPDVDDFELTLDETLGSLWALGDVVADAPDVPVVRARLEQLSEVQVALTAAFTALRDEAGGRLRGLDRGRRGLSVYARASSAPAAGARLGRG